MEWNLFKRKKDSETALSDEGSSASSQAASSDNAGNAAGSSKKGRPTPKRSQAEARKLRPLVPKDRKASRKAARLRSRERQDKEYEAMRTGDIAHMPAAERLPFRIYIRNYVDSRWNIAEYFMPFILVVLVLSLVVIRWFPALALVLMVLIYAYFFVAVADLIIMWRGLKKQLILHYGEESVNRKMRSGMYAAQRAMNIRRWRLPKPAHPKHSGYKQWREKNIIKDK